LIDQPAADDDEAEANNNPNGTPTYPDLYNPHTDKRTQETERKQKHTDHKLNPLPYFRGWWRETKWTDKTIAIFTIVIAGASLLQWREMSNAGIQTDRIIKADERLAKAMEDSVGQAQRAFDATSKQITLGERAWLEVRVRTQASSGFPARIEAGRLSDIRVTITNTGRTPAINVRVADSREPVTKDKSGRFLLPKPIYRTADYVPSGNIPPSGEIYSDFVSDIITQEDMNRITSQGVRIYIHGRIEYWDVYGVEHWLTFCNYLLPLGGYAVCEENNDIDKN